jgi:hypothetical protein
MRMLTRFRLDCWFDIYSNWQHQPSR